MAEAPQLQTHRAFERARLNLGQLSDADAMATEAGWIIANSNLGPRGSATIMEDWQILLANLTARYSWWAKSRQVGYSWTSAMQKLARSYLVPHLYQRPYLGVFLSINQEEAQNKIFYMLQAWDTLPSELKNGPLKLTAQSKTALEFANGSRVRSHPAKAVRGLAGADITMDEAAHIPKIEEIYRGTTAASIRVEDNTGGISIGSTPQGEVGLFHGIGHSPRQYLAFRGFKYYVYWWDSVALCTDVVAARKASLEENWVGNRDEVAVRSRIERFASRNLKDEFGALPLEDFLQEYEIGFNSVADALIPYSVLMDAVDPDWPQVMLEFTRPSTAQVEQIWQGIQQALKLAGESAVWAGYDYARKRDQAVLMLVAPIQGYATTVGRFILRDTDYDIQEEILMRLMMDARVFKLNVDVTGGMGAQTAERLVKRYGDVRVVAINFTNIEKQYLAAKIYSVYSQRRMAHTGDREILRQAGSVRRKVTPSGKVTYEGGGSDNHADVFWAMALAVRDLSLEGIHIYIDGARNQVVREYEDSDVDSVGGRFNFDDLRSEYRDWMRQRRRGEDQ